MYTCLSSFRSALFSHASFIRNPAPPPGMYIYSLARRVLAQIGQPAKSL